MANNKYLQGLVQTLIFTFQHQVKTFELAWYNKNGVYNKHSVLHFIFLAMDIRFNYIVPNDENNEEIKT